MSEPSIVEVKAYGDNLFSDDVIDGNYKKTAAELTWEQKKSKIFEKNDDCIWCEKSNII